LRQNITNSKFSSLASFVSAVNPQLYYEMEYYGKNIFVYDENWEYQRTITHPSNEYLLNGPTYSININGSINVTANEVVNKYDNYFNLTKRVNSPGYNRGIYYNSANQMIYNAIYYSNSISVYDKDLSFNRTISKNCRPWFITGFNGQLVVTDDSYGGNIYFYQGESSYRKVPTNCGNLFGSILFDNYNQMIVTCVRSKIYIYNVNGTNTGLQVNACVGTSRLFINFDSKDRF